MLENARRQLFVVIAAAALAIIFLASQNWTPRLGLDLQGGVQLIYEVDVDEAVAREILTAEEAADDEVVAALVDETIDIIAQRVDPNGTRGAVVTRRGISGILIELPELTEAEAKVVESQIEQLGQLEFRIIASSQYYDEDDEVTFDLTKESQRLQAWLDAEGGGNRDLVSRDPFTVAIFNSLTDDTGRVSPYIEWYPALVRLDSDNPHRWSREDPDAVKAYTPEQWNGGQLTEEMLAKPAEERFLVSFLPINKHEKEYFRGEDLNVAAIRVGRDQTGRPAIDYQMKPQREPAYADWTEEFTRQRGAIILNGNVYSAPTINGRILGSAQIFGSFTKNEAQALVDTLRTGALKVRPQLESRNVIGATLGQDSINRAFISMVIGALLVLGFILAYYRLAGLVAFSALALNILLIFGLVVFMQSTLTLPGLAGLVLTMGMAVDSNILIYERIREELRRGKELVQACRTGFDRAISAIVDSNITTFIAGAVMFNVGVGPIRGFAVTLMIGILTTLFTAFFVSRLIFHYLIQAGKLKTFKVSHWLEDFNYDFLGKARPAVAISVIGIIASLAIFAIAPTDRKFAIDFTGGANLTVSLRQPMAVDEVREVLTSYTSADFPDPIVNTVGADSDGRSTQFGLRLKLTAEQRAEIKLQRDGDPDFEPPYLAELRKALGDLLVAAPFTKAQIVPNDDSQVSNFASLELHFASPVAKPRLDTALATLPQLDTSLPPDSAKDERDWLVQFDVTKEVTADALFARVQTLLEKASRDTSNARSTDLMLSDPIPESAEIGGQMVGELRNSAISALVIALFAIVMYIRVRFHEFKYGVAAIVGVLHDVVITLGFVVVANWAGIISAEINIEMIAAFLTIIGYSINDTIVIFDRVRENLGEQRRLGERIDYRDLLNLSINQTLSRTLLTTVTTLFVVITQFVVNFHGNTSLEGFSFALLIGLFAGTYSTVFIASPIVLWLWNRETDQAGSSPAHAAERSDHPVAPQPSA